MPKKIYSLETRNTVSKLVPMDDIMFQKMCEEKATCQEIISTILGEAVLVVDVIPQDSIMNLQGRSVRLDCLCKLKNGVYVNVEVQKSDDDDHEARVRYNASVITANETPKSVKFKDVAQVIVIFISKFDIYRGGLPIYHIDRVVRELGAKAENGFTEIYVNSAVKKHDNDLNGNVSDLMDLFTDRDTFNYDKFPVFSKRKNMFTNTEKGAIEMCEKVDQLVKTIELNNLFMYAQDGDMPVSRAARRANVTPKEFRMMMQKNGYKLPQRRTAPATAK